MSQKIQIFVPTYISDATYSPARVMPRLLFYNGTLECEKWWMSSLDSGATSVNEFPYFDNYNVVPGSQFPTTGSKSLLFNNEATAYGQIPNDNLYTTYWSRYVELLYDPYTRILNAEAVIPLADYFDIELNDIIDYRGNYWHLRAINDYNLKTGECKIQLLGPILAGSLVIAPDGGRGFSGGFSSGFH
jgi:hypothetical protein